MADQYIIANLFKTLGTQRGSGYSSSCEIANSEVAVDASGNVRKAIGPTVGEICCHITGGDRITSTISFHIKELRNAGLVNH